MVIDMERLKTSAFQVTRALSLSSTTGLSYFHDCAYSLNQDVCIPSTNILCLDGTTGYNPSRSILADFHYSIVSDKQIDEIGLIYEIADPIGVRDFLNASSNPDLLNLLQEAPKRIHEHFRKNQVRLGLEVEVDPEEATRELLIILKTRLAPRSALDRLDALDREWFLTEKRKISERINLTVEYR
jgi:hypothetical protein